MLMYTIYTYKTNTIETFDVVLLNTSCNYNWKYDKKLELQAIPMITFQRVWII